MAKSWSRWRFSRHALVSALVLCVLAWQALVAIPAPRLAQLAGLDAPTSVIGAHCNGQNGEHSPTDHRHSACCLFCAACGRDGPPSFALAELPMARTETPSQSWACGVRYSADGPALRPLGWTSSWSSRAPPVV